MRFAEVALGTVGRRVALGVGANVVGKVWVALIQLISIPVLAGTWGADRFGVWLMVTTVPAYIALAATGFNSVSAVDMAKSFNDGFFEGCRQTLQSTWAILTAATFAASVIIAFCVLFFDQYWSFYDGVHSETVSTALVMVVYAFCAIQSSIVLSVYRASGRYALGTLLYDLIGLTEGLAVIGIALADGALTEAACVMVIVRALGLVGIYSIIAKREPWSKPGTSAVSVAEIRRLLHPSLGALTVAGANVLAMQGVVIGLGLAVGPAATASFASARTLARLPLQVSDLLGRATLQDMARSWFSHDRRLFWRLTRLNIVFAIAIMLPFTVIMALFGDRAVVAISGGHIVYERWLPAALAIAVAMQGLSVALGQSVAAQTRQHTYGYAYLALAGVMAATPYIFARSTFPTTYVALSLAFLEALALAIIIRAVARRPHQTLNREH